LTQFINIHALQTLPPSALNRDDSGMPKKALFGGVERARISSQSWKYAIRQFFAENYDASYMGCRTTQLPSEFRRRLLEVRPKADGKLVDSLVKIVLGVVEKTEADNEEVEPGSVTSSKMIVFYSPSQLDSLVDVAVEVVDGKRKSISVSEIKSSLVGKNTVDLALFGRMMTANAELSVEAAASVAHIIGVDKLTNQRDSFVGIDDALSKTKIIGSIDFVSSTVYRYACLDTATLSKNLDGDAQFTADAVGAFVNAFVRSMPSGKQSSFAAQTLPHFVLVTISDDQPLSLASAFSSVLSGEDIASEAVMRLIDEASSLYDNYGLPEHAFYIGTGAGMDIPFAERLPLKDLVVAVKNVVVADA